MDMLKDYGCHQGQGHFIAPPLPNAQFEAWCLNHEAGLSLAAPGQRINAAAVSPATR